VEDPSLSKTVPVPVPEVGPVLQIVSKAGEIFRDVDCLYLDPVCSSSIAVSAAAVVVVV